MAVAEIPNYSMMVVVSSCCSVDFHGRRGEQICGRMNGDANCGIQERYRGKGGRAGGTLVGQCGGIILKSAEGLSSELGG